MALFLREVRSFKKGNANCDEKLIVVPGPESSPDTPPVEGVEPEPPATANKASASKGKGSKKGETEQPPPGDDGTEAQWRAIRSEVQSNRCLVMRAGGNISLATLPLFSGSGITEEEGRPQTEQSVLGDQGNPREVPEEENTKANDAPGVCHDGVDAVGKSKEINKTLDDAEPEMRIDRSSPFVVCLDFRLDLAEALLNIEGGERELTEESDDVVVGEGSPSPDDKVVRILSCGNNVEISAVIRLWAPTDAPAIHAEAEHSTAISGGNAAAAAALTSDEASSLEPPSTDASAKSEGPASATRLSEQSSDDDAKAPPTSAWYLHSLSVRSGSYVGTVPCVGPEEPVFQQQELVADADADAAAESSGSQYTRESLRVGESVLCELAEWHAIALVANTEGDDTPVVLCVDGEVLLLRQDVGVVATDGTTFGYSELLAGGAVVMGGTGREWTSLAVKNLAVYSKAPGIEQLRATTRVFRRLREEQQAAKAADEKAEERWLEEVRKAEEEEREPGETMPVSTQATTTCRVTDLTAKYSQLK